MQAGDGFFRRGVRKYQGGAVRTDVCGVPCDTESYLEGLKVLQFGRPITRHSGRENPNRVFARAVSAVHLWPCFWLHGGLVAVRIAEGWLGGGKQTSIRKHKQAARGAPRCLRFGRLIFLGNSLPRSPGPRKHAFDACTLLVSQSLSQSSHLFSAYVRKLRRAGYLLGLGHRLYLP